MKNQHKVIGLFALGVVSAYGLYGAGEALVWDVPSGTVQTYSSDINAASINKTGGGDAVVNASSVVLSGRVTSSAGTLTVTGTGTRTFGSTMAADGQFSFVDVGDVSCGSVFVRSSSLCAMMSVLGSSILNGGSGTMQLAAGSGQRGCLYVGAGSSFSIGAFQSGKAGCGIVEIDGGSVSVSGATTLSEEGGTSLIVADGGSFVSAGAVTVGNSSAATDEETLIAVVGNGGVVKSIGNDKSDFAVTASAAHRTVVAVADGGVFGAAHVTKKASEVSKLHLGFNGGVLAPTYPYNFFNSLEPDSLTVYEGGITIDTSETKNSGAFGAVWLTKQFVGPTGMSISEIALPTDAGFASETYSGPVPVVINGNGVGAAAVVRYDAATKRITSIRVVCPGTGYDSNTTATIRSEDGLSSYSCAVTMTVARNSGNLVKRGGAVFRLYGGNTYGGDTVAAGGELVMWADDSLPSTSGIFCKDGAVFNLNNKNAGTFSVPRFGGVGGRISNGNVSVTDSLCFDGIEIAAATNVLQLTGSLTIGNGVKLSISNYSGMKPLTRYEVLHADGGITGDLPDTERYGVEISGGSLFLTRKRPGFVLIVR